VDLSHGGGVVEVVEEAMELEEVDPVVVEVPRNPQTQKTAIDGVQTITGR